MVVSTQRVACLFGGGCCQDRTDGNYVFQGFVLGFRTVWSFQLDGSLVELRVELFAFLIGVQQHKSWRFGLVPLEANRKVLDLVPGSMFPILVRVQRIALDGAQAVV